jgi:hypothetical protein
MNQEFYPLKYKIKLIGTSNRFETEAPADTCVQFSIIGFELLRFLGYKETNLQVVEIRGISDRFRAYKATVKVISENKKFNLDMIAVKEGFAPKGVILGTDFLKAVDYLPRYLKDFSHLYRLIKQSKRKCVLILGEDRKHLNTLYQIKERLKKFDYEGILLKSYPDIEEQSIEEKMNLFGHLAKFVICENSYPSEHIDELNICTRNRLVTVILQRESVKGGATWMQACYPIDFNFVRSIFYKPNSLNSAIDKAVRIAESLVRERTRQLNQLYIHRKKWLNKSKLS